MFIDELRELLAKHSLEKPSTTPDFIVAAYLEECLDAFNEVVDYPDKEFRGELYLTAILGACTDAVSARGKFVAKEELETKIGDDNE